MFLSNDMDEPLFRLDPHLCYFPIGDIHLVGNFSQGIGFFNRYFKGEWS